jgi:hypothetical protein
VIADQAERVAKGGPGAQVAAGGSPRMDKGVDR